MSNSDTATSGKTFRQEEEDLCFSPSFVETSDAALHEFGDFSLVFVELRFLLMKGERARIKKARRENDANRRRKKKEEEEKAKKHRKEFLQRREMRDATAEEITGRANRAKLIVRGAKAGLWKLAKPSKTTSSSRRRSQRRAKAKAERPTPASPKETATASDSKLLPQSIKRSASRRGGSSRFSPGES